MPMFTVVIPAHNREKYIARAIKSVFAQTYQDFELIVVDDHSTDQTAEVVRQMMPANKNLRLFAQSDSYGAQAARNRGIREAHGAWITFLDSDDEWTPDHLETMADMLQLFGWDKLIALYSDYIEVRVAQEQRRNIVLPDVHTYDELLMQAGPMFQGLAVSRDALEEVGGLDDDVPSYQEWDTALNIARVCHFVHIKKPLFVYYLHADETISKDGVRDVDGLLYQYRKYHDDILCRRGQSALHRAESRVMNRCLECNQPERFLQFYRMFRHQEFVEADQLLTQKLKDFGKGEDDWYIYGAGSIGSRVRSYLADRGFRISGYLVSDGQPHAASLQGVKILEASKLSKGAAHGIFIATRATYHDEIVTALSAREDCRVFLITEEIQLQMRAHFELKRSKTIGSNNQANFT